MNLAIKQINILDMLEMYGEDSCSEILSTFICPLNLDIADFIHNKAIDFAKQRIAKFSQYDTNLNKYLISMPLIAQLGRNYSDTAKEYPISGNNLLNLACQNIKNVQHLIGGKTTYIECASNPKLHTFYSKHDFVPFGERKREFFF